MIYMKRKIRLSIFITILLLVASLQKVYSSDHIPNILVIHSYNREFLWTRQLDDGITAALESHDEDLHIYREYLDTKRFSLSSMDEGLFNLLSARYKQVNLDLVILTDDNAIDFTRRYRKELFNDVPILFCGLNRMPEDDLLAEGITGIVEAVDIASNIDLISTISPETETIYAVAGSSVSSRETLAELQNLISLNPQWKPIEVITDVSFDELKKRLSELSRRSVVLNLAFWRDREGQVMSHEEILPLIAESSPAPVFSLWDHTVQYGTLGGVVLDGFLHGKEIAERGLAVLDGASLDSMPVSEHRSTSSLLIYDIFKKFSLREELVPREVVLKGKPLSFFVMHRDIILIASFIISILTLLIIWLVIVNKKLTIAKLEIDNMNLSLTEKVKERTRQLEQSMEQLIASEKEGLLIKIISGMAHTFNTPLGVALTSLGLVKSEVDKLNPGSDLVAGLDLLTSSMDRMIKVINQLKQYSGRDLRDKGNQFSIESCLEVLPMGFVNFDEPKIEYEYTCPPDLVLFGQPTVLTKILLFLVENSILHGFEKKVSGNITVDVISEGNDIRIEYRDNGTGISEEERGDIFEPFFAGEGRKKMSGLGLAIAEKLIQDEFSGRIILKESLEGVFFEIILPKKL